MNPNLNGWSYLGTPMPVRDIMPPPRAGNGIHPRRAARAHQGRKAWTKAPRWSPLMAVRAIDRTHLPARGPTTEPDTGEQAMVAMRRWCRPRYTRRVRIRRAHAGTPSSWYRRVRPAGAALIAADKRDVRHDATALTGRRRRWPVTEEARGACGAGGSRKRGRREWGLVRVSRLSSFLIY